MKKTGYILRILLVLVLIGTCLVSCNNEPIYHYSGAEGTEDLPVMGTVDDDANDSGKKRVAITYDDGPHNVRTKQIVDELEKYGFSATFFVIGNRIDGTNYNGAEAIKYAAEKGNEIGIHGYTHTFYYNKCSDEDYKNEISKTEDAIKDNLKGTPVRLMRPIGGAITSERVQKSKFSIILWDVDSEDWKYKYNSEDTDESAKQKVNTIVSNVMNNVKDGSIILMHDIYESTYDATVIILKELYEEGYEVVSVSELLGNQLSAGKMFSRLTIE